MVAIISPLVTLQELGDNRAVIELLERGFSEESGYVRFQSEAYTKRESSRSLYPMFSELKNRNIPIYIQFCRVDRVVGGMYLIELCEGSNEFFVIRRIDDS